LKIEKTHYNNNHPEVAYTLFNLGTANAVLGDAKQTKECFERTLNIQESNFSTDLEVTKLLLM